MEKDNFQNRIRNIYGHLEDNLSKDIFSDRLMYSLTGDYKYIMELVCRTAKGKEIHTQLIDSSKKKVIFGAGIWGKNILTAYENVEFECFVDNKAGADKKEYMGLPVVTLQKCFDIYKDFLIVIASRLYHQEIYEQLIEKGVEPKNIINAGKEIDDMSKKQYFDLPVLREQITENEVFVDGGSFDGRTSMAFVDWCHDNYKKIYAFEPDPNNQNKCRQLLKDYCKYEIIEKGLWSRQTELKFNAIANGSSKVVEEGTITIPVVSMDEVIIDEVTFIKLDVEGSEYEALRGARNIITKYKPKMAISIYHKPEDIWELPELILSLNENYRFYLRHYSIAASETVLYAV